MATLAFSVEADYDKVIRLRDEIARLETELDKVSRNGTPEEFSRLESQLASCRQEMKNAVAVASQLGMEIEQGVGQKMREASGDVVQFGQQAEGALSAIKEMDFGTAQEKIDALSYAIFQNETVIAESVRQLSQWRDEAREAFEAGDSEALQSTTEKINAQIQSLREITGETREYRAALEETLSAAGADAGADVPVIRLFDSVEEMARVQQLQQSVASLKAEIAQVGASGGDTTALTKSLASVTDELNQCNQRASEAAAALGTDLGGRASESQQQLYELNRSVEEQNEVIDTLREKVAEARDALDALTQSGTASSDEVERASASYMELSASLSQAEERLSALQGQQMDAQRTWDGVNKEIEMQDSFLVKLCGGYDNFNSAVSMMPGPLQNVVRGITTMTSASMKFIATPVGAIIMAIVLALQALYKWFNSSADGQQAFAKITGYVTGLLGQLNEIVLKVGKAIFKAFQDPKQAMKDFGQFLKDQVMNRIQAVGGMVSAFGDILKNVFNGKWSEAKDSLVELGKQYAQAVTGVENVVDKVNKGLKKMGDAATEQANISVERQQLEMDESAWQVERQRIEGEMEDLAKVYRNTSLSQAERKKALDEYKKYNQQLTDTERQFAEKRLELVQRENALTTNPNEAIKRENEAKAAVLAVENEGKRRLTALTRTEASLAKASGKGADDRLKTEKDLADKLLALQAQNEQDRIDLIEDSTEQQLAKIEYSYNQQIAKVRELAEEMAKANAEAGVQGAAESVSVGGGTVSGLTAEQQQEVEKAVTLASRKATSEREQITKDTYRKEAQYMWDFLKEYGDYEERKLAITQEYEQKIADATNEYQKKSLENERDEKLSMVDDEAFENLDWQQMFASIDQLSVDTLTNLKERLVEAFESGTLSAEHLVAVSQKIDSVNAQIADKMQKQNGLMGSLISQLKTHRQLQEAERERQERINKLQKDYNDTLLEIDNLKQKIVDTLNDEGIEIDELDIGKLKAEDGSDILSKMTEQGATEEQKQDMSDMFSQFSNMQGAADAMSGAMEGLSGAAEGASGALGGMAGAAGAAGGAGAIAIIDTIIHAVNDNIQSVGDLMEETGMRDDTAFARGTKDFMESSEYATQGWEDLKSGDVVGVVSSVIGSLSTLGNAIGQWAGGSNLFGESDVDLHQDIERLTLSNKDLEKAVGNLTEELTDQTASISEMKNIYERTANDIAQMEANTQEMMSRSAAVYNMGFMGLGGTHSSNSRIDEQMTNSDWKRVSDIVGRSITSASDFWTLTSEEMYKVSVQATDLYSKIKLYADDGYEDAAQYMDDYIEYWKELRDVTNTYYETLLSLSFDSLTDSFKSAIMDMDHTAADFADDFEEMMKNAIVGAMMSNTYAERLQDWYDSFAEMLEASDGYMTRQMVDDLQDEYNDIVEQAQKEVKALYDVMGWDTTNSNSQTASSGSFQTMSEDTGQELNGRFTAMYESMVRWEGIGAEQADTLALMSESLDGLLLVNTGVRDVAEDALALLNNSYLELMGINENTGDSARYLRGIRDDISAVKQYTSRL